MERRRRHIRDKNGLLGAVGEVFFAMKRWAKQKIQEMNLEITFEQLMVMMVLEDEDGVSLGDLSELIDREKTTITRMVDGLENMNLVMRVPSREDRRKKLIYLTGPGKQKIQEIQKFKPEIMKEAFVGIDEKEMNATQDVLDRVFKNLTGE